MLRYMAGQKAFLKMFRPDDEDMDDELTRKLLLRWQMIRLFIQ